MILELVWTPFFLLMEFIISLIPIAFQLPAWALDTTILIQRGLSFFPSGVSMVIFTNILFWLTGLTTWAIIEWVYKKIPGVS